MHYCTLYGEALYRHTLTLGHQGSSWGFGDLLKGIGAQELALPFDYLQGLEQITFWSLAKSNQVMNGPLVLFIFYKGVRKLVVELDSKVVKYIMGH